MDTLNKVSSIYAIVFIRKFTLGIFFASFLLRLAEAKYKLTLSTHISYHLFQALCLRSRLSRHRLEPQGVVDR